MKMEPEALCLRRAARQHGVISRSQLLAAGVGDDAIWRRVSSGLWTQLFPGVYAVPGAPASWKQDLMAACLWAGDGAAASHRAAAALLGLEGFPEGPLEISGCRKTRRPRRKLLLHYVDLPSGHRTRKFGIPITTPARTLVDLAAVAANRVERALDDALRKGLTSLPQLHRTFLLMEGRGRKGVGVVRTLLAQRNPGTLPSASDFQARVRKLFAAAGLPPMVEEHEVWDGARFIARVDFAYPELLLAIEADGYASHSGRLDWQHDRARRNALTSRGWRVLHVTWEDLNARPDHLVAEVKATFCISPRQAR
jgi:hypothetical protein